MIYDNYWKKDLNRIKNSLILLSKIKFNTFSQKIIEHKINKCFLFSSIIIRKIIDDEKDFKKDTLNLNIKEDEKVIYPKFAVLDYNIKISIYSQVSSNKFFINSKFFPDDYKYKEDITDKPLNEICNQIIHSYVWANICDHNTKKNYGIIVASDIVKKDCAFLLTIEEWIKTIDFVIDNCKI